MPACNYDRLKDYYSKAETQRTFMYIESIFNESTSTGRFNTKRWTQYQCDSWRKRKLKSQDCKWERREGASRHIYIYIYSEEKSSVNAHMLLSKRECSMHFEENIK